MTIIDIGAQIGYLSLEMAFAADHGTRVVSFEPEPVNLDRFSHNIALNRTDNVTVVPRAVSDRDGAIRLYMSKDNNAGTHSTIQGVSNVSSEYIEIPCVRLDSYVSEHAIQHIGLIKIDVEGGELEVVRGAEHVLRSQQPALIIEMSSGLQSARGFTVPQFKSMLKDWGFSPFTINDDGTLRPSPLDQDHAMDNVVFLPPRFTTEYST